MNFGVTGGGSIETGQYQHLRLHREFISISTFISVSAMLLDIGSSLRTRVPMLYSEASVWRAFAVASDYFRTRVIHLDKKRNLTTLAGVGLSRLS